MSKTTKRKTKRSGEDASFVGIWVPTQLLSDVDQRISATDSDRSKFIRDAIKRKLQQPA